MANVRSDLLEAFLQDYPVWAPVVRAIIEENLYIVFPASHEAWTRMYEGCLMVYEPGVKGEPSCFEMAPSGFIESPNYGGSHRPMTPGEFLSYIRIACAKQAEPDVNLIHLLEKDLP